MVLLAKVAMVLSYCHYTVTLGWIWLGQIFGFHNDIWEAFDFPAQSSSPPTWALTIGTLVVFFMLCSLGISYLSGWKLLNEGVGQDFRLLGVRLKRISLGLLGFWFAYNLQAGGIQYIIAFDVQDTTAFDFGWDPLDTDIIFAIVAIILLAISQTLNRAWEAEEENKYFL